MMNKKGSGFAQFVLNSAVIVGILYFIFIVAFGAGGGLSAAFIAGGALNKLFSALPWWGIIAFVVFIFWLFFGRK